VLILDDGFERGACRRMAESEREAAEQSRERVAWHIHQKL
jgi:hypothetical protein